MDVLDELAQSGQSLQDLQDFARRYEEGEPWEGYSDEEVVARYHQLVPHLPPDLLTSAAEASLARLSPEDREEFATCLEERAGGRGHQFPELERFRIDESIESASYFGQVVAGIQQQYPAVLEQLLLSGCGSASGDQAAKAVLAGIVAMAVRGLS